MSLDFCHQKLSEVLIVNQSLVDKKLKPFIIVKQHTKIVHESQNLKFKISQTNQNINF